MGMKKIFVSGLCNVETACRVSGFPIEYSPVEYNFDGITSCASGVGLNLALALTALGDSVTLLSFAGGDAAGEILRASANKIARPVFLPCPSTPQSVVLFDKRDGRRRIYTDLKDMQQREIPSDVFEQYADADAYCLCNIGFSRSLLPLARAAGKPVCCDVHCLSELHDAYNADFIRFSDILFLSNESIRGREGDFIRALADEYPCRIIVAGMGEKGALLYERGCGELYLSPAVYTRRVVNTVGAGDALFSAFPARESLDLACRFASYKIGESGAAKGFLDEESLLTLSV